MNIIIRIFAAAMVAVMASCSPSMPRHEVIEYPQSDAKSPGINVTRIELTDTATVLDFHVDCPRDYWIMIASTSFIECQGRIYGMVKASGMVPDEKFWITSNYGHDFSVTFPPIPADADRISFAEGHAKDHWKISGIRLHGSN